MKLTIGLDIAKNFFQIHAMDAAGIVVTKKMLRRSQMHSYFATIEPSLVGIEARSSAHHWARELSRLGHTVRLMPPSYVKPYVKRGRTTPTTLKRFVRQ